MARQAFFMSGMFLRFERLKLSWKSHGERLLSEISGQYWLLAVFVGFDEKEIVYIVVILHLFLSICPCRYEDMFFVLC